MKIDRETFAQNLVGLEVRRTWMAGMSQNPLELADNGDGVLDTSELARGFGLIHPDRRQDVYESLLARKAGQDSGAGGGRAKLDQAMAALERNTERLAAREKDDPRNARLLRTIQEKASADVGQARSYHGDGRPTLDRAGGESLERIAADVSSINQTVDGYLSGTIDGGVAADLAAAAGQRVAKATSPYVGRARADQLSGEYLEAVRAYAAEHGAGSIKGRYASAKDRSFKDIVENAKMYDCENPNDRVLHTQREGAFVERIVRASSGKASRGEDPRLEPSEVFKEALEACDGNVHEAFATMHYGLRHLARQRGSNVSSDLDASFEQALGRLNTDPSVRSGLARMGVDGASLEKMVRGGLGGRGGGGGCTQGERFFDTFLMPLSDTTEKPVVGADGKPYASGLDDGGLYYHTAGIFHVGLTRPQAADLSVQAEHAKYAGEEYDAQRAKAALDERSAEQVRDFHAALARDYPNYAATAPSDAGANEAAALARWAGPAGFRAAFWVAAKVGVRV